MHAIDDGMWDWTEAAEGQVSALTWGKWIRMLQLIPVPLGQGEDVSNQLMPMLVRPHLWFNLKIFGIVLFESANKFGQLCWNYEILEPIMTLTNVAHPTYLVITYGPNKKTCSQCNMSTIFTQFCLQLLHQYIDCVVTITNASPKALRYGAFLDMES